MVDTRLVVCPSRREDIVIDDRIRIHVRRAIAKTRVVITAPKEAQIDRKPTQEGAKR